jgi:tRNA-specific 2-thiouridylase
MEMMRPGKVLVAMSGGVDSSVAACLLKEQGHDVVGVFMRLGPQNVDPAARGPSGPADAADRGHETSRRPPPGGEAGLRTSHLAAGPASRLVSSRLFPRRLTQAGSLGRGPSGRQRCCSAVDATDAGAVAGKLGISFYALNFEADFARLIDTFVDEYAAAQTPNPCVLCNQWLKFGKLVAYADAIDADLIATGHYARVDLDGDRPRLLRARYLTKDQSYVLFGIAPDVLRRTRFPLGEMTKEEVRTHARRLGLTLHDKPESQDICFVPDGDYARVVRSRRPDAFRRGRIRHVDGRVLGEHDGLAHFTIGQRRGLGVAVGSPLYVTDLDPETNTVSVGPRGALLSGTAVAADVRWLCEVPTEPFRAHVKIRYHHAAAPAEVEPVPNGRVCVRFDTPQPAVTPGQAMVFYRGDEVLGGGWIRRR